MKLSGLWSRLYAWVLEKCKHPHAERWLFGLSFAESSFFPIPPDVMLAPMALAQPQRWLRLALLTTAGSVIGGLFGWIIGHFLLQASLPLIERLGYLHAYETARGWFEDYGILAVLIAGFTPIPYKVFTIAAGGAAMPLPAFLLASTLSRGARFLLVAGLMRALGPRFEPQLARWVDGIGWATVAAVVIGVVAWNIPR